MATRNRRVGDELRQRREELELSLHKVEVITKIRGRYLRAIEASDFASLPNDIYSRGFIRQYAAYLDLPAKEIAQRYLDERGGATTIATSRVKPRPLALRLGATSRWAASLVALTALALIIGYLVWQFSSLTGAPQLKLDSPAADTVLSSATLKVSGSAAPGSDVFVNDSPLPSDVNGKFSTDLVLHSGVNEVRIAAKNKLGKQTLITRNVLNKLAQTDKLPDQKFDGVALLLTTSDTSSIKIVTDGQETYNGLLAKGSTKLITATSSITISAQNPSIIKAKLTNSVVAGTDIGQLSNDSSTKSFDFTKTTTFSK